MHLYSLYDRFDKAVYKTVQVNINLFTSTVAFFVDGDDH